VHIHIRLEVNNIVYTPSPSWHLTFTRYSFVNVGIAQLVNSIFGKNKHLCFALLYFWYTQYRAMYASPRPTSWVNPHPTGYPPPTQHSRHGPQHSAHSTQPATSATPRYPAQGRRQYPCRRAGPTQTVYVQYTNIIIYTYIRECVCVSGTLQPLAAPQPLSPERVGVERHAHASIVAGDYYHYTLYVIYAHAEYTHAAVYVRIRIRIRILILYKDK